MTKPITLQLDGDDPADYAGDLQVHPLINHIKQQYQGHRAFTLPVKKDGGTGDLELTTTVAVTVAGGGLAQPERVKPTPDGHDSLQAMQPERVRPTPDSIGAK